ncbi:MAG: glutathione S-transferase N-terminal domain-containing protein [Burkholderiales bacterium]|nr:glutathione S-transferase N-terminal domain-containing protein [Burkholderiales bacterium]
MKLWYSPPSPFARKARIAALELGLAERVEQIEVAVAPHKPNEEFGRRNPLMKVPALETDDGFVLFDSRVICEYLDAQAGGDRLIPAAPGKRWTVLRRQALGDGVTDAGILRRYELAARPEALRWADWLAGQQKKIDLGLDLAEREAAHWGKSLDIGQIAIACALHWLDFRFPGDDWRRGRPALAAWLAEIGQRPSFAQTMPRA